MSYPFDNEDALFQLDTLDELSSSTSRHHSPDHTSGSPGASPPFTIDLDLSTTYLTLSTVAECLLLSLMDDTPDVNGVVQQGSMCSDKGKARSEAFPTDIPTHKAQEYPPFDVFSTSFFEAGSAIVQCDGSCVASTSSSPITSASFTVSSVGSDHDHIYGRPETVLDSEGPIDNYIAVLPSPSLKGKEKAFEPDASPRLPPVPHSSFIHTQGDPPWPMTWLPPTAIAESSSHSFSCPESQPSGFFYGAVPPSSYPGLASRRWSTPAQACSFTACPQTHDSTDRLLLAYAVSKPLPNEAFSSSAPRQRQQSSTISQLQCPHALRYAVSGSNTMIPRNYFDEFLPRELKLIVFAWAVPIREADHERTVRDALWTTMSAGWPKNRWVGRALGHKDLLRYSQVSKTWQSLLLDGQLWANLNLDAFPRFPSASLIRLVDSAGGFVRSLSLQYHARLATQTLVALTHALTLSIEPSCAARTTQLISLNLCGCTNLEIQPIHELLMCSPSLQFFNAKGLHSITNATCAILASECPRLVSLDIGRCPNVTAEGAQSLANAAISRRLPLSLKVLRASGLRNVTDRFMTALGKAAPYLEVLDLSGALQLHNTALAAFVSSDEEDEPTEFETVLLTFREVGRDPDTRRFRRRVTRLRHLALSSCPLLTDDACANLAYAVPRLEFLELAGIGAALRDDGLIRLLQTTPLIRRLDLEEACEITDVVIRVLTPVPVLDKESSYQRRTLSPPQPGEALEYLSISYAAGVSNGALQALLKNCPRLKTLFVDNTRVSGTVVKDFVKLARERDMRDAQIFAVDCRAVGEPVLKQLARSVRPRLGWRSWHARRLEYLDGRDQEGLPVGQDECDERRVVVKTFYSWQTVDAVRAAREKRRKDSGLSPWSRRSRSKEVSGGSSHSSGGGDGSNGGAGTSSPKRPRWWVPGSRRGSGATSPVEGGSRADRPDVCIIM